MLQQSITVTIDLRALSEADVQQVKSVVSGTSGRTFPWKLPRLFLSIS